MAILDGLEVTIKLPVVDRPLSETPLPSGYQSSTEITPWAVAPRKVENYVTAPEGQAFSVCLTLLPSFDRSLGDGLHLTLKIDDGQTVNHYYSIKFDDMDRDQQGNLTKTIPSAVVQSGDGHRTILFSFGQMPNDPNGAPFGYYSVGRLPSEGKIVATIIRVTHHQTLPRPMAIPPGSAAVHGDPSSNRMVPIPLANVTVPDVDEQVLPIDQSLSDPYCFVFRYRAFSEWIVLRKLYILEQHGHTFHGPANGK